MEQSSGYGDEPFNPIKPKRKSRKEYHKEWRDKNKDKIKRYYQNNIEEAKQYSRDYYYSNREKQLAYFKEYRKDKPEYFAEANKRYRKRNSKKFTSRIATVRWINGTTVGKAHYKKIEGPDEHCHSCGENKNLQLHHEIYPTRKRGIVDAIKNGKIYYLCKDCHMKIHRRMGPKTHYN